MEIKKQKYDKCNKTVEQLIEGFFDFYIPFFDDRNSRQISIKDADFIDLESVD